MGRLEQYVLLVSALLLMAFCTLRLACTSDSNIYELVRSTYGTAV